ncbi:MAG: cytochrome c3 family protein [Verrucomicrobia bacterium]|nr:cytochrome c3 family protein [Verrucomicrobiota bacterium]
MTNNASNQRNLRMVLIGVLALTAAAALLYLPAPDKPTRESEAPSQEAIASAILNATLPQNSGPKGYVTSDACLECHPKQHDSWAHSFHSKMTQVMSTNSVVADFNRITMDHQSERFTMDHEGNQFWVEIRDATPNEPTTPSTVEASPPLRIPMGLVTGSHHLQVFWLPAGYGNMQIGFPFTWLIDDARWVPREDAFIRPPDSPPQKEIWNLTCIRCHTTASQPRPEPANNRFDTHVAELGISCEACHGPGDQHVQHQQALARLPDKAEPNQPDTTIVQPQHLESVRASQVCAFCHSMKWFDDSEGWKETGFKYRPGDDLETTTPIIRPTTIESQPWLHAVLEKHPDLLGSFFWNDGMIRVAGREYNGLVESPCFQKGTLSCLSCHSLHYYESNDDQLARGMNSNQACLQCHETMAENIPAHTHHAATSSGSECYNCHMPHTAYALLKATRSHQIDSPNLTSTIATGRPNACNLCHLDQTLEWTGKHLQDWYAQTPIDLRENERTVSSQLIALLSGDAGQRALAAWSMGWEPAREASGSDWQPTHLARLLDDPYSAVRYIAARSLRSFPGFEDLDYNFTAAPEERTLVRHGVLEKTAALTLKQRSRELAKVLYGTDGKPDEAAIQLLQSRRNDRPIRLRE